MSASVLGCGFAGRAQIGKGMWAMPDRMADMRGPEDRPSQGGRQHGMGAIARPRRRCTHCTITRSTSSRGKMNSRAHRAICSTTSCRFPLIDVRNWGEAEIRQELENNIQGILGYVVRWIDQGIGCSKVPDIDGVGLMEDRATLRISSQHVANWLRHNVCTREQVLAAARKMAKVVDAQNEGDKNYRPMSLDFDGSIAFQAACSLIFDGCGQPNGYTELILHRFRAMAKKRVQAIGAEALA